jgi:hypothetical protein
VNETAFHNAMGTDKPLWEWMTEKHPPEKVVSDGPGYPGVPDLSIWNVATDEPGLVSRPELENFALAMVGGGKTSGAAHAFDFPWGELGEGLVVDVGGGIGTHPIRVEKSLNIANSITYRRIPPPTPRRIPQTQICRPGPT